MLNYIAIVHKDIDGTYKAQFPDLPGCIAAAENLDDLKIKASEALALHLEGRSPPMPRTLVDLFQDQELMMNLFQGCILLPIPLGI